jgi:hypothetical protein
MSRYDLDLVSYTEDLLSKIKTANRSNYLTHKTLKRKIKLNQVLWLAALGLGAAAGWIRGGEACCGADRGGAGVEEAGSALRWRWPCRSGGHGSIPWRRWAAAMGARFRGGDGSIPWWPDRAGRLCWWFPSRRLLGTRRSADACREAAGVGRGMQVLGTEKVAGGKWHARWVRGGDP